jgi:hypothetical protein
MRVSISPLVMARDQESVGGFCEHGDDLSRCAKGGGIFHLLIDYQLLREGFVPRIYLGNYSVITYDVICFIDTKQSDINICSCEICTL